MDEGIDVSCSICFAIPGELCRTKYVVHGYDEVTPVICPTHSSRLVDSHIHRWLTTQRSSVDGLGTIDYVSGHPKGLMAHPQT
jgi:hypothetical protein